MGFKTFNAGDVLTAADVNDYLMEQANITCTSASRPSSPIEGMVILETDTDKILVYSGSAWVTVGYYGDGESYTPSILGSSTNPTMGNSTVLGRYWRRGTKRVEVAAWIKIGSTFSAGSGSYELTLPLTVDSTYNRWPLDMVIYDSSGGAWYRGFVFAGESTVTAGRMFYHNDGVVFWPGQTNSLPVTLATNDIISVSGFYYAA